VKHLLRKIFSPILKIFESGTDAYAYKPSHRIILIIMGSMFSALATLVFLFAQGEDPVYLLPVLIFGSLGATSLLVGFIGTERAVEKIWSSKK